MQRVASLQKRKQRERSDDDGAANDGGKADVLAPIFRARHFRFGARRRALGVVPLDGSRARAEAARIAAVFGWIALGAKPSAKARLVRIEGHLIANLRRMRAARREQDNDPEREGAAQATNE